MGKQVIGGELGMRLIRLLGLPERAFEVDVHITTKDVVTASCKYYPALDSAEIEETEEILAQYELCEKKAEE